MVIVDRELPDLDVSTVMVDNFQGGYLAGGGTWSARVTGGSVS